MATSCQIYYSNEEKITIGYYSIEIPYEINHNFLLEAHFKAQEWKIFWVNEVICFSDYGEWTIYDIWDIDNLILKLNDLEKNIDNIAKIVPIPKMIGMYDWRVIVWYESHKKYNSSSHKWENINLFSNYVEILNGSYLNCEKKDILYIIDLIRKLALRAKKINKPLVFIGE